MTQGKGSTRRPTAVPKATADARAIVALADAVAEATRPKKPEPLEYRCLYLSCTDDGDVVFNHSHQTTATMRNEFAFTQAQWSRVLPWLDAVDAYRTAREGR